MHKKEPLYSLRYDLYLYFCLRQLKKNFQGLIQDFVKEGVVSMRVQGKHPGAKGMGEEEGRVMFGYVGFLHFDFRGINLSNVRHYIKD